ncbi:MAG: hypothetical protein JWQ40_3581 [Segetibacter sp.]|nr:hypothetical protein [Segetibacter sp.]
MENLQQSFFQKIKQSLPAHLSLVDEVATLLNISNDSAYRRIRNEKSISFEEIKILAAHFKISVDHLLNLQTDTGSFSARYITPGNFDFSLYLEKTYKDLELIAGFKEKEIYYYCKDFPLFYYYAFPEIAAFKSFIWMKTSFNFQSLTHVPFSFEYYMKPFIEMGRKIFSMYARIPGTEIMNVENIITTLLQIEYYKNSFMFGSSEVVATLLNKLDELTIHIRRQAEEGVKFLPSEKPNSQSPKYNLYANDFVIGDNSCIAICDNNMTSFIIHSHVNYMTINDSKFTNYHYGFIKNIIKKSILISDTGERYRERFFHLIHEKIEQCRNNQLQTMG